MKYNDADEEKRLYFLLIDFVTRGVEGGRVGEMIGVLGCVLVLRLLPLSFLRVAFSCFLTLFISFIQLRF